MAVSLALLTSLAYAQSGTRPDGPPLSIAIGPVTPPLLELDESGTPRGFVVDLLREAVSRSGHTPDFYVIRDETALDALEADTHPVLAWLELDPLPTGYSRFEESCLSMDAMLFERANDATAGTKPNGEKTVVVAEGSQAQRAVRKGMFGNVVMAPSTRVAMEWLAAGSYDGVFEFEYVGREALRSLDITTVQARQDEALRFHHPFHLARADTSPAIEESVTAAVTGMIADGSYAALHDRWLSRYEPRNVPLRLFVFVSVLLIAGIVAVVGTALLGHRRLLGTLARRNEALRTSESRLKELLQDIDAIVWEADLEGRFTYVNAFAERIFGYPRETWLEQPDFFESVLLHPEDRDWTVTYCREQTEQGLDHELNYRAMTVDGGIVWVHEVVHVVTDRHGVPLKIRGVMFDISEHKRIEADLRKSKRRLAAIMQTSPVGIFRLDAAGGATFTNDQAARITGLTEQPPNIRDWLEAVHPDDRDLVAKAWAEAQREGKPIEGEFRYLRPDNEAVWVLGQCHPERDANGNLVGFVGTITDITEQKAIEGALRESQSQLGALMKASPVGIFRATTAGTILFGNERAGEITGLSGENIQERTWMSAIHPDDRQRVIDGWRTGLETKEPIRMEYRFVHPDGSVVWVYGLDEPQFDEAGDLTGWVGTLTDITDKKNAERQLRLTQFAVDTSADPTFWVRPSGEIVYANQAACESLEYTYEKLTSLRVADISVRLTPELWDAEFAHLREHGVHRFESQHRTTSGRVFPVEILSNHVVFDDEEYLCAFARDITERREHETALRDRAAFEHLVAELSSDLLKTPRDEFEPVLQARLGEVGVLLGLDHLGFLLVTADGPRFYNHMWDADPAAPAYEDMQSITKAWPWVLSEFMAFRPVVLDNIEEAPPEAALDRTMAETLGYRSFVALPLSFAPNHVGLISAATKRDPVHWEEDTLAQLRVVGEIISNALLRHWSEEALRASEARFDRAMRGSSDGYWDWPDVSDDRVWWSPQFYRMLGYGDQEFPTSFSTFIEMVHPDEREHVRAVVEHNLAIAKPYDLEYRIQTKGGEYRWFRARGEAIRDEDGRALSMSGSVQDVTEKRETEKALRESEEKFRRVAENALVGVAIIDDGRFVFANDAALRLTGRSREELFALPPQGHIEQLLHPDDRPRFRNRQEQLDDGQYELFGASEARMLHPDGGIRWASIHTSPLVPNQRYPVILIASDITERKEAERALQESEEKFRRVAENALVGIALIDESGYTYANDALLEMCGLSREELYSLDRGSDIDFLFPSDEQDHVRAMRRTLDENLRQIPVTDVKIRHKDGAIRWVSVLVSTLVPGRRFPVVAIAVDITERKRAEEALRRREELLRRTEASARVGGWEMDFETREIYLTEEVRRILELPDDYRVTFDNVAEFYSSDDYARLQAAIELAIKQETPWDLEFRVLTAKGRHVWVRSTGYAIKEDGRVTRLQGAYQDISERKQAEFERRELERQIQQAQKLESLGVLAGGIAHDFNNLLVSILGHADLAQEDLGRASPAFESVKQIELAARRAADLAQQMLAYSGKGKFVVESIDLSALVREIAHLLEVSISKKVAIRFELANDLPLIHADTTQMQQIIMNLITNASDAIGDEPGLITLRTGVIACSEGDLRSVYPYEPPPAGSYVLLEVVDTGCGMDEDTRQRIFDPFFTTKFAGRGLGLAAVLGIVRGHRGALEVDSTPGGGTRFRILFPAAPSPSPRTGALPAEPTRRASTGTVLVIDDEDSVRALAERALERFGHRVFVASDGQAGIEIFRDHADEIDAVLLDMTMPVMNGEEVVTALHEVRPELPVLLMSGYSEQEAMGRFEGNGIAGFLQKPFQLKTLREKLESVLNRTPHPS